MKGLTPWIITAIIVFAIFLGAILSNFRDVYYYRRSNFLAPSMKTVNLQRGDYEIKKLSIRQQEDRDKSGEAHSRLFYKIFHQRPRQCGNSYNIVHINFDNKAEILGFLISIDWSDSYIALGEFMAGINNEHGYGLTNDDIIIHTSYSPEIGTKNDQDRFVWFGSNEGFVVSPEDFIGIGAWLCNVGKRRGGVSPEFIIYYRWL